MTDSFLSYEEVERDEYVFPGDWVSHSRVWLAWQAEDHQRGSSVAVPLLQMVAGLKKGGQRVSMLVEDEAEEKVVVQAAKAASVDLSHVTFYRIPHVGLWMRDMGPQFSQSLKTGKLAIVDWNFNQWGHEEPTDHDSAVNERVHHTLSAQLHIPLIPVASANGVKMIHEGGGVAHNGRGTMIAVESVAMQRNLGPHRFFRGPLPPTDHSSPTSYQPSPQWNECREELTRQYKRSLGVKQLIWLPTGVYEDEGTFRGPICRHLKIGEYEGKSVKHSGVYTLYTTNGHGDEFVKFVTEDTVVLTQSDKPTVDSSASTAKTSVLDQMRAIIEQQNYERMERACQLLQQSKTAEGKPIKVIRVPAAPLMFTVMEAGDSTYDYFASYKGWVNQEDAIPQGDNMFAVLPTSYVNYLATGNIVLVAKYWKEGRPAAIKERDEAAWRVIGAQFPSRTLVPIDIEAINLGGGGIHCSSQQQPNEESSA